MRRMKTFKRAIGRDGKYDSLTAIRTKTITSADGWQAVHAFLELHQHDDIEAAEVMACSILEAHGLPATLVHDGKVITEVVKGQELTPAWHAAQILFYAHATRQHIQTGNAKDAVWTAMRLQNQIAQLIIRDIELDYRIGAALRSKAANGRKYSEAEVSEWERIHAELVASGKSERNIAEIIARRMGYEPKAADSIRKHFRK